MVARRQSSRTTYRIQIAINRGAAGLIIWPTSSDRFVQYPRTEARFVRGHEIRLLMPGCAVGKGRALISQAKIAQAFDLREIGNRVTAILTAVEASRLNHLETAGPNLAVDAERLHVAGRFMALKIMI